MFLNTTSKQSPKYVLVRKEEAIMRKIDAMQLVLLSREVLSSTFYNN